MRRVFFWLVILLVAGIVVPPLWFRVHPAEAPPLPAADRRIAVGDGVSVSAVDRGEGPAMVLVHGLPGCGADWAPLVADLVSRGFRVIAYDRVGYGGSDPRPDDAFTPDGSAADLLGLLERERLADATVVGWSYGGATAIRAAIRDDTRIGRVVLVGSAGPWPDAPEDPAVFKVLFSAPVMDWMRAVPPFGRAVQRGFSLQAFGDETMPAWWLPQLAANFASPHTQATYRAEGASFAWDDSLDPAPIERPVLVIHGDADLLVPLSVGETLAQRAGDAELVVVEGGSHMLPVTRPKLLGTRIAAFAAAR